MTQLAMAQKTGAGLPKAHPNAKKATMHQRAAKPVAAAPGGIQERAMLVGLTVHRWNIGRHERGIEEAVAKANEADVKMMSVMKQLVRKEALQKLGSLEAALRTEHHFLTLPWGDDGMRVLSSAGYFEYTKRINALVEQYATAADEIVTEYPELKADAKKRLGHLYKESDYPTPDQLRALYRVKVSVRPMPASEDFRVNMSGVEAGIIRNQIKAELDEQMKAAHRNVWERLHEVLTHAVDRLKQYSVDGDGKVEHPFRKSLVENIRELLGVVPLLNVSGDANLTEFAKRIEDQIASHSIATLRYDPEVRQAVISEADDILAKMSVFMA